MPHRARRPRLKLIVACLVISAVVHVVAKLVNPPMYGLEDRPRDEEFYQTVKRARLSFCGGMGLREFAETIGMLPSDYCDSEYGRRPFTKAEWGVVACVLGLPLSLKSNL